MKEDETEYLRGTIKAIAAYKTADSIEGDVTVDYQHMGTRKLDLDGKVEVKQEIKVGLGMTGEYKIDIKPGTGAEIDVKNTQLKIAGQVNARVSDAAPLVDVELKGSYEQEGTKFNGSGKVTLLRKSTRPVARQPVEVPPRQVGQCQSRRRRQQADEDEGPARGHGRS